MKSYSDVQEFRKSEEAIRFSEGWLEAQRSGDVTSDFHMNLLAWTSGSPFHVLGIVLNLIDSVGDDDSTAEQIVLGPVEWLIEHAPDSFVPVMRDAISDHSGFALYTKSNRLSSADPRWKRLQAEQNGGGNSAALRASP
jgi:hypothetical protein